MTFTAVLHDYSGEKKVVCNTNAAFFTVYIRGEMSERKWFSVQAKKINIHMKFSFHGFMTRAAAIGRAVESERQRTVTSFTHFLFSTPSRWKTHTMSQ